MSDDPVADAVSDAAAELYGAPPETFTERRGELAAAARSAGDRIAAKAIGALRRPTRAAWLVNRLARTDPSAPARLADLGGALRAAQTARQGARLRELSAARGALIDALTAQALAAADVAEPPGALRDEVAATLTAALADPAVAAAFAAGTLTRAAHWSGFGGGDSGGFGGADFTGTDFGAASAAGEGPADTSANGGAADDTAANDAATREAAKGTVADGAVADGGAAAAAGRRLTLVPPRTGTPARDGPARTPRGSHADVTRTGSGTDGAGTGETGTGTGTARAALGPEAGALRAQQEAAERAAAERAAQRRQAYAAAERVLADAVATAADAGAAEERLEAEVRELEDRLTRTRADLAATRMKARHAEAAERRARLAFDRLLAE